MTGITPNCGRNVCKAFVEVRICYKQLSMKRYSHSVRRKFYYPEITKINLRNMELWRLIVKFRDQNTGKKMSLYEKELFYSDVRQILDKTIFLLNKYTIPVTSIEQLAQVASSRGDYSMSFIIADAFKKVGVSGLKMIIEGNQLNDELEVVNGIQLGDVRINPMFADHCSGIAELDNSLILLYDIVPKDINQINVSIEKSKSMNRPLIIISNRFDREVLHDIIQMKLKEKLDVVAVELIKNENEEPSITLKDFSVLSGTEITPSGSKENILGNVNKCYFQEDEILLLGLDLDDQKLDNYISQYLQKSDQESSVHRRITKLKNNKTGLIKIGGTNDQDVRKRMAMAIDMLGRADEAVKHGIIAADGRCLLEIIDKVSEFASRKSQGVTIIDAMKYFYVLMYRDGQSYYDLSMPESILLPKFFGYDLRTKQYINLLAEGKIDPKSYLTESLYYAKFKCIQYSKGIQDEGVLNEE